MKRIQVVVLSVCMESQLRVCKGGRQQVVLRKAFPWRSQLSMLSMLPFNRRHSSLGNAASISLARAFHLLIAFHTLCLRPAC